ncbi:zinc finger protein 704-like [Diadema setosum]|uniref:zinc finger protein 704-like n=1 Tax=Diadema setosum TaxID=31175 RepID=UPI003B3AAB21
MHAKRNSKRSIIGTRVGAMRPDGHYYPGIIRNMKSPRAGETLVEVAFEDGIHNCTSDNIIGPGFRSMSSTHLKFNQPVFVTVNGREVRAIVQKHLKQTNEVLLKTLDVSETIVKHKIEDVRLLESRKLPRSMEQGTDFSKLADMSSEAKKRPVSTNIEVPSAKSQKVQEMEPPMDDVMAAMVLTSLCGTGSPLVHRERNPSGDSVISLGPMSPASSLSSGYGNVSPSPSPSTLQHFTWDIASRNTPSPASSSSDMENSPHPNPNLHTAQGSVTSSVLFSSSVDEGIDISGGSLPFSLEEVAPCSPTKKFKPSVKTSYKCTWQRCGKTLSTVQGIERHIRTIHLRKKEGEEYSDHEEEFYYTEIDTTVESVSDTLANMFTSSPPPTYFNFDHSRLPHPHPDGLAGERHMEVEPPTSSSLPVSSTTPHKSRARGRNLSGSSDTSSVTSGVESPLTVGSVPNQAITMVASPVTIPSSSQYSWSHVSTSFSFPSTSTHTSQASHNGIRQKNSTAHHKSVHHGAAGQPKIRSEGKKCRKVYGMDNKDMWCTQCRWKKACVRFT